MHRSSFSPAAIALALGLAVSAASVSIAQAPAATPPAPPTVPGVSPQGNAVIAKIQRAGDPTGQALVQKLRALLPQISQTALAPTVDVEKFGTLLKQQDALTAQIQVRRSELMINVLRQLPAADRGAFLRAIANRPVGQPAPPPAR